MKKLALFLALALILASGTIWAGSESEAGDEPVTVSLWTHMEPGGESGRSHSYGVILDMYEANHPNVDVAVEVQPWTEMSGKFMAAHASGNAPDVSQIQSAAAAQVIQSGALEDLMPWVNEWSDSEREDFYIKEVWNNTLSDGGKYLFGIMNLAEIMVYRADYFDDAGITVDDVSTWDGFVEAAGILTRDSAGNSLGSAGFDSSDVATYGYGMWAARNSGAFVMVDALMATIDGSRALNSDHTANWTSPTGVRAFTMLVDLMEAGVRSQRDLTADLSTSDSYFASGSEAMHHLASFRVGGVMGNATFDPANIRAIPYPGAAGNPASVETGAWYIGMSASSAHKQEAWELIETIVSPEADLQWVMDTPGLLPARASTIATDWFQSDAASLTRSIADAVFVKSHFALTPPVDYREYLILAYHSVIGGESIETALARAADDYNTRLSEAQ